MGEVIDMTARFGLRLSYQELRSELQRRYDMKRSKRWLQQCKAEGMPAAGVDWKGEQTFGGDALRWLEAHRVRSRASESTRVQGVHR
jgi:hypothetical protein